MNANRLRKQKRGFDSMRLRDRWRHYEGYKSYLGFLCLFGFIGSGDES